jgi:hypothetical protein
MRVASVYVGLRCGDVPIQRKLDLFRCRAFVNTRKLTHVGLELGRQAKQHRIALL